MSIQKARRRFPTYKMILLVLFLLPLHSARAQENTQVINRVTTQEKVVALTFDADMTPKMLRELREHTVKSWYNHAVMQALEKANVPATLFLTGMWIVTYPRITKQLSDNPLFELGNHSYLHGGFSGTCYHLNKVPESSDANEIAKTDQLLSKFTARAVKLFRFPGLCYDTDDLAIAAQEGYTVIGGDVLGDDGFQKRTNAIVTHVVRSVKPGSIVILHMHGGPNAPRTAEALPLIITQLRAEGYTFVKTSDLLRY